MDIASGTEGEWRGGSRHRAGGLGFKDLFLGDEGPGNYWFSLVRIDDYSAPPHRHNFDQVRFMISGGFGFGDQVQPEGSVGYFTEGVTYTQRSVGPNLHVLLQCEGGNGATYISADQMARAVETLSARGRFEKGRYLADGQDGAVDGFEACWTEIVGHPPEYVSPRFDRPIIMNPQSFARSEMPGQPGVTRRRLGQFTERDLEIGFLAIEAGRVAHLPVADADIVFYAVSGEGQAETADEPATSGAWRSGDGLRQRRGQAGVITARTDAELFYVRLPR